MYRARFLVAGSFVAITTALLTALAFLPMYLALHAAKEPVVPASLGKSGEIQKERTEVARAQSLVTALSPFVASTTQPSEVVGIALALRPKGISVDHVSYASGVTGEIMIVGFSLAREAINVYRQALQADAHFKTVSVPVGDLAGTQGGRFSVTLTGDF